jgi:diguanylate cyclase (GGDEF)-like protein/PAS domain S-box-containing protein
MQKTAMGQVVKQVQSAQQKSAAASTAEQTSDFVAKSRLKASLVPSLILFNVLLVSMVLITTESVADREILALAYLGVCVGSFLALFFLRDFYKSLKLSHSLSAKSATIKQDKTISLLLRDFDEHSSHWLWETAADGHFVRVQDRFLGVAGRSAAALEKLTIPDLIAHSDTSNVTIVLLLEALEQKAAFTDIHIPVLIDGVIFWWSLTGAPDFDDAGSFTGYHGVGSDITKQKTSSERIQFLAHHDVLTGLYNRAHFSELLNQNVSRLERYGAKFSLMFLDLDFFKAVNDSYGHPMGDKLLVEVAHRIRAVMPQAASIARLGGDEFAVIFAEGSKVNDLEDIANATLKAIQTPFEIDGETLQIGVSIGIALAPHHGTRPDQLLRNVDLALYRAKETGRDSYCLFEPGMDSVVRERRALEFDLRFALDGEELELFYQPFVNGVTDEPEGFEALLRWNHPIRGQISPAEFIPIAESTGLIGPIGEWVLFEACRAAASWPDHLRVAVNLSALQFSKDRVVEIVTAGLAASGLSANRLELEITESLLIDQPEDAVAKLLQLKGLGVSIAMDDFGTGYSSLSYMLKFPFDKIKIDKSFISAIENASAANDVLRTIASLGKSLKVQMTAEGVETERQSLFLKELEFDHLQGFFYSKPLKAREIPAFLLTSTGKKLGGWDKQINGLSSKAA